MSLKGMQQIIGLIEGVVGAQSLLRTVQPLSESHRTRRLLGLRSKEPFGEPIHVLKIFLREHAEPKRPARFGVPLDNVHAGGDQVLDLSTNLSTQACRRSSRTPRVLTTNFFNRDPGGSPARFLQESCQRQDSNQRKCLGRQRYPRSAAGQPLAVEVEPEIWMLICR